MKTRMNKRTLLLAAKKCSSVCQVCKMFGKDEEYEEHMVDRLLRAHPGSLDFIDRNDSAYNMKLSLADEDFKALKEYRQDFIGTVNNLINSGLLKKYSKEDSMKMTGVKDEDLTAQNQVDNSTKV